tara:strand:- start:433 stop:1131 length:699 start_codon:yes stop_codon:yes gene_type:complete
MNPFLKYYNSHKDESAILFGSGPTIKEYKNINKDILKVGLNEQIFLGLDLDYWFMGDSNPQYPPKFFEHFKSYDEYKPALGKFIRICRWDEDNMISVEGFGEVHRNGQLPLGMKNGTYYEAHEGGNPNECLFKEDISEGSMSCVASISFEALQFMLYTGVTKIYLVGHDCDYTEGTFTGTPTGRWHDAGYYIHKYWKVVKEWVEVHYPEVEIYSINPVGLSIFPTIIEEEIA